jgi:thioester reductase-like protein
MSNQTAVLLTGATGLVGGELLPRLLASRPNSLIYCIIRPRNLETLEERRSKLLDWAEITGEDAERVIALEGDVTKSDLGLGERYVSIAREVREIFASAANIRFDLELEEARRINRDGLRHLIDFAFKARSQGEFRRFNFVSTAYVCGDQKADPEPNGMPRFHNTYEQSKWEAEQLLLHNRKNIPTTCYRPSIIVGNSKTGKTPHFHTIYDTIRWAVFEGLTTVWCYPNIRSDVVPVDYVCDATIALSVGSKTEGKTYYLTAGLDRSISNEEFARLTAEVGHEFQRRAGMALTPPPRLVSFDDLDPALENERKVFEVFTRRYLPYMMDQFLFDDSETRAALQGTAIECPNLRDYLRNLIYYYGAAFTENRRTLQT